jgi:hypothetical protein
MLHKLNSKFYGLLALPALLDVNESCAIMKRDIERMESLEVMLVNSYRDELY